MNEVVLNKKISIERCIEQINTYYALDRGLPFEQDFLKQDAIAMTCLSGWLRYPLRVVCGLVA